jgi:hypothetical protein
MASSSDKARDEGSLPPAGSCPALDQLALARQGAGAARQRAGKQGGGVHLGPIKILDRGAFYDATIPIS